MSELKTEMTDINVLVDVLEHMTQNTQIGLFLYECTHEKQGEEYPIKNQLVKNDLICKGARPIFHITKENIFIDLEFEYEESVDIKSAMYIYSQWLDFETSRILNQTLKSYAFVMQVFNQVDGYTYMYECINPSFVVQNKGTIHLVFSPDNFTFGRTELDTSKEDEMLACEERTYEEEIKRNIRELEEMNADE